MIEVHYSSQLGNRLFQYALARILSAELNLYLPPCPINGFPCTECEVKGKRISRPTVLLDGQDFDWRETLQKAQNSHLVLAGNFQQSRFYIPWANELRHEWLRPQEPLNFVGAEPNSLVIHIRRTDYLWQGWGLPFSSYQSVIEEHGADRVVIVTDDPNDPFIWRFARYKPTIRSTSPFDDFLFLRSARYLMISPSSFSWWAAFLSVASKIYFPVPQSGIWAPNHGEGVNLAMPGDDRYVTVFASEPLSLNSIERVYFERLFWRLKLKDLGWRAYLHSLGSGLFRRLSDSIQSRE